MVDVVWSFDELTIGDTTNAFFVCMFSLNSSLMICRFSLGLLVTLIKVGFKVSLSPPIGGTGLAQCAHVMTIVATIAP